MSKAVLFFVLAIAAVAMPAIAAEPVTPVPYVASYAVSYRGVPAGLLHVELRSAGAQTFVFETHPDPNLLASFVVGNDAVERSVMLIDGEGVRPLSWRVEDGKSGHKNDGDLQFDWSANKVSGTVEDERVEAALEPGLQDRLSIQMAVMTALLRGEEPGTIPMINDHRIKRYSYTRTGSEWIRTTAGEFETILYQSTRPGSSRLSRIWHAPLLGYIPVRAEQLRKGKVETVMELVSVKRGDGKPMPLPVPK